MAAFTCSSVSGVRCATSGPATSATLARQPCSPALPRSSAVMAAVLPRLAGEPSRDRGSAPLGQPQRDVVRLGGVVVVLVPGRSAVAGPAVVVGRRAQVLGVDVRVVRSVVRGCAAEAGVDVVVVRRAASRLVGLRVVGAADRGALAHGGLLARAPVRPDLPPTPRAAPAAPGPPSPVQDNPRASIAARTTACPGRGARPSSRS